MSTVYFISDLHFDHRSLIPFRNEVHGQSFKDVVDMNLWIVDRINAQMTKRDHLWILGDVAFGSGGLKYLSMVRGTKSLILGNHDRLQIREYFKYFGKVHGLLKKHGLVLSHCPLHPDELTFRNWNKNVHGHIHHIDRCIKDPRYVNVNMDVNNCTLTSLDNLIGVK